ncbi:MAG: DUF4956 domain-containing protein [Prochlorococcus marinus XMU1422]|nr:DUF4956 domain-containing protein [Prochlorococcus marinus XMU1421]MBO7013280.1 DUF4956 domain-containing protein [Prochlorococcus marinus XMU1422]MCR8542265.1 DUF4956 domain-containing protein [Prochlorococcus marinus XMU1423]
MLDEFINLIFSGISLEFILRCLISIFIGGFISLSLILSGQNWAKSFSNVTTFCILPIIGLVITTVISKNIALSLGMVGALSIIRFRHPVKSPLELSIYFLLLTVGITISTSIGKAIVLSIFCMTIVYSYSFYKKRQFSTKQGYLDLSFSREEPEFILEITCSGKNTFLSENKYLLFSNEDFAKNKFTYKLSFFNKNELNNTKDYLCKIKDIEDIKYYIL